MKNLFNYATKELSQDAFLRWLFENYNCENKSVRQAFKVLFESFTDIKLENRKISEVKTVSQWKKIDVSIWFKLDNEEHLIIIEDKTESFIHEDQLHKYDEQIKKHNEYWKKQASKKKNFVERFLTDDNNLHKVFYKTNVLSSEEKQNIDNNKWKKFDIYSIYELFAQMQSDNEILTYYIDHIKARYSSAKRTGSPNEWNLIAWNSFFNNYKRDRNLNNAEIGCYKNEYYYIKLFVEGHENEFPCLEIRSKDYKLDKESNTYQIITRAVLYNLSERAKKDLNVKIIEKWQAILKKNMFSLNYRKDLSKHKQIGSIVKSNIENSETGLIFAFDGLLQLIRSLF